MIIKTIENDSYTIDIYIAGSYEKACEVLRGYCEKGFCVSISRCNYIYTYGSEDGVRVTLINYPRFPSESSQMLKDGREIAELLVQKLHQGSASIVSPDKAIFISRRKTDEEN